MLDVHPPHHAASTWRDFFIHIATICVGLLIAVGLEQTVEAIHHHRQLRELRESMSRDSEKANLDATNVEMVETIKLKWLLQRLAQTSTAIAQHKPLPDLPIPQTQPYDYPTDPTWKAAKSSGLLALMSQDEVKAYSEVDDIVNNVYSIWHDRGTASDKRQAMETQLTGGRTSGTQITDATPTDLIEYQRLLRDEIAATTKLRGTALYLRRAETAILHGARSLDEIQSAEKASGPDSLP
jgi:hypothetical protein